MACAFITELAASIHPRKPCINSFVIVLFIQESYNIC